MELISPSQLNNKGSTETPYYLQHHAVYKEISLTTKTRVVFDTSLKTSNGTSLNDTLMVGPIIQLDLFSIIIRFRTHAYVMTTDISKMYRQIRVDAQDCDLLCILWCNSPDEELGHYRLTTVTYGTASAAFRAIRCLQLRRSMGGWGQIRKISPSTYHWKFVYEFRRIEYHSYSD